MTRLLRPRSVLPLVLSLVLLAGPALLASPPPIVAQGVARHPAPESRLEAEDAMNGAVAAAVLGTLDRQFPGRQVEIALDTLEVVPASVRDRSVDGTGRLRLADDETWLPFHFTALYDTEFAVASAPRLTLGATADVAATPIDDDIARLLDREIAARLAAEFSGQAVGVTIDQATGTDLSSRFLKIEAGGTADFGREGRAAARIGAVFDRSSGRWLHLDYELGPSATATSPDDLALR